MILKGILKRTAVAALTMAGAGALSVTAVSAEPSDGLRGAVEQLRSASQCGALRYDPIAEQTAEIVNRSTDIYLDHTARHVPVSDPLPVYRDLGGDAGAARSLFSANNTDAETIKGLLLQGYAAIPDCAYTGFGASMLWNAATGKSLATVVLVGPQP